MTIHRIVLFAVFLALCNWLHTQVRKEEPPSLIVGIVVDGLQEQHLHLLRERLSDAGIRRIITEGTALPALQYNITSQGVAADVASLMSGTVPFFHGVAGNVLFNKKTKKTQSILYDAAQTGIGTADKFSAKNLLASTFTDELQMAKPASRLYVVAIEPETAVMLGGHLATGVVWIDNSNIRWATSGYYNNGLIQAADAMNTGKSFTDQMTMYWRPLYTPSVYYNKPLLEGTNERFRYNMRQQFTEESERPLLKNTPFANVLVNELAVSLLRNEKLGKKGNTDVLLLQYTVCPPNDNTSALGSAEKEDMYFRLDKEVAMLLSEIEQNAGLTNTVIFLTATQSDSHSVEELKKNYIPAGYFSAHRAMSLLNVYLMAIYGQEAWVDGYAGKNIYLNREKIEEKKLNLRQFQQTVADFMLEFEGVQASFTAAQVVSMGGGNTEGEASRVRNSYSKIAAGDVVITLLPGWVEVDENENKNGTSLSSVRTVPLYLAGWKIPRQTLYKPYWITDLAPTLCWLLNIPAPNANIGNLIEEVVSR